MVINFFRDLRSTIFGNSVTKKFFHPKCLKVRTGTCFVTKKALMMMMMIDDDDDDDIHDHGQNQKKFRVFCDFRWLH